MNALEEREKTISTTAKNKNQLFVVEPPRSLFNVVVNNYKQAENFLETHEEEVGETMINHHEGLPPQPSGYIKFPEHDWF